MPFPQAGRQEYFRTISLVPSTSDLSTPPPMVSSLLDWREVIIQLMKDGNGKRTLELGLIVTMSCYPWDSNIKLSSYFSSLTHFSSRNHTNYFSLPIEQNPPNPPQQDTPIPHMPCEQSLWQPTPSPSGTQWLEELFHEPSQHNEPLIPGLSQSSELHEVTLTHELEPEVALTQSTEDPLVQSPFLHSYPGSLPFPPRTQTPPPLNPMMGLPGIYQLANDPNDSSSNFPQLNQPDLVEASLTST
ncbi:hypothetical protein O181_027331 [Austropuccinia psidii MF-1]|uniref:Uncharacterized protein n=1 Tax=Austropuccinia psidii MF-1 TaxID=1389203 RepID=A0A9Q3H1C8_9BASI|nr:hypothetical protein [Austropuccinia psidii MF-1]